MTREIIGDACAFIKGENGEKNRYVKIGLAMRDGERISFKLDALPTDKRWDGWVNVFPRELPSDKPRPKAAKPSAFSDFEDDIPF